MLRRSCTITLMNGETTPHADDPKVGWQFKSGDTAEPATAPDAGNTQSQRPATDLTESVSWTASEFIEHNKDAGWYGLLALATVVVAGLVFLLTRDKVSTSVVVVAAVIFGFYAARKPRTLNYRLDSGGLTIGEKFYDYGLFRSFTVVREGPFSSIDFMPLKRFMPLITIYFEPKDEAKIAELLSERLPMDHRGRDWFEQLMHRIRY